MTDDDLVISKAFPPDTIPHGLVELGDGLRAHVVALTIRGRQRLRIVVDRDGASWQRWIDLPVDGVGDLVRLLERARAAEAEGRTR